jgi:Iap family predicted aminopeptidase
LKKSPLFYVLLLAFSVLANLNVKAQNPEDRINRLIDEVSIEHLTEHIQTLEDAGGTRSRLAFTPGVDSAAQYVKKVLDSYPGLTSVELDTFYISSAVAPYNTQPQVNVVATIEGRTHPEKIFVIGAHLDATADRDKDWTRQNWKTMEAPGADDNATGIASILELARIMSDEDLGFVNDFTIKLVAFGAEERGTEYSYDGNHHGSTHFANKLVDEKKETIGMVSMDMIGFNLDYNYASIVKQDNMKKKSVTLGEKFYQANHDFSIGLITNKSPFATGTYSDHQSFSDAYIPAILIIENAPWKSNEFYRPNPYYHTSNDTFETVNIELVKKITQLNLATMASYNGISTAVEPETEASANQISLSQNYPNPFNPTTVIKYQVQKSGPVALKVYNMLGREVAVLVDENKSAGAHQVIFDANKTGQELSSGIYLYQLQTPYAVLTNKMTLIK